MSNKRAYGTGSAVPRGGGVYQLKYRPEWADKPLFKRVHVEGNNPRKQAYEALQAWVAELDAHKKQPVALSVETLHDLLIADYRRRKRETTDDTSHKWKKHIDPYFVGRDLIDIDSNDVEKYVDDKLAEGLSNATVNRHVSWLHKAVVLARKRHLTKAIFDLERLDERAGIRHGFISHDEYLAIMRELPAHLQMLWCFAYHWGIRKGELLKLRWEWALPYLTDDEPIIKIPGFDRQTKQRITKNGEPHTLPLYMPEMLEFLKMALSSRAKDCPYVFQYQGRRLRSPRTGFENARRRAGLEHVLIHDTRRTAVRNMIRAGIDKKRAMQISGHRTDSIFYRYDIEAEGDATEAGAKMRGYMENEKRKHAGREKLGAKLGAAAVEADRKGVEGVSGNLLN
ncbi:MAG: site-specific integrase [Acidobacteriaceae bacterium]|nr:site-specific integrase [Acidobacteriaceae bacterium]